MSNHLIIGLGGTGGKVLREFRKRVYEEFRSNEPGGDSLTIFMLIRLPLTLTTAQVGRCSAKACILVRHRR